MNLQRLSFPPAAVALALVLSALPAAGQDPEFEVGDDYRTGDYGRVTDSHNGVQVIRANWQEQADVTDTPGINSPIFSGDEIVTQPNTRTEVQLAGGTLVWVGADTRLEFAALPDPYAEVPDNAVLRLKAGSLRMSAMIDRETDFRIDTPAVSVYPLDNAEFRVDVGPSGRTTVSSHRGLIEVAAGGGSVLVRSGTRSIVSPGSLPQAPEPFHSFASDALDNYAESRNDLYSESDSLGGGADAYRQLPNEVRPYYKELAAHGSWNYVDEYGYVWRPVGVTEDWRPYNAGYWGYGPHGYFWISNEPWGWAPYHYGRWSYISGYGWGWTAGSVFGGAWVSWSWGSTYVGWGPLDYWNYPAYRSHAYIGYYDPSCWTFVSYSHFHYNDYHHHHASWDDVHHSGHNSAAVTRPPNVSPRRLASSEGARRSALDQARASRNRIDWASRPKTYATGFRSAERHRTQTTTRSERAAISAPDGRSRHEPNLRSPRRESLTGGNTGRAREGGQRERLPVTSVRRPPATAGTDSGRRVPTELSNRRGSTVPIGRANIPKNTATSPRSPVDGRMRDVFRKASRPRQTTGTPSERHPAIRSQDGGPATRPNSGAPTPRAKSDGNRQGGHNVPSANVDRSGSGATGKPKSPASGRGMTREVRRTGNGTSPAAAGVSAKRGNNSVGTTRSGGGDKGRSSSGRSSRGRGR